jgi:hypothetical protein
MSDGAEGASNKGVPAMCDYSLQNVRSRPAKVGDKLTTRDFGTGTRGFAAAEDHAVADGRIVLLTRLSEGQEATVLQLPVQPTTAAEADAQQRLVYVS